MAAFITHARCQVNAWQPSLARAWLLFLLAAHERNIEPQPDMREPLPSIPLMGAVTASSMGENTVSGVAHG